MQRREISAVKFVCAAVGHPFAIGSCRLRARQSVGQGSALVEARQSLAFERVELFPGVLDPFETQAVDEIERARCPLVVLVLMVGPENKLDNGARVAHSTSAEIARLVAEAIEELLADDKGAHGPKFPQ